MKKTIETITVKKPERQYVDEARAKYFERLSKSVRDKVQNKPEEDQEKTQNKKEETRSKFYNSSRWKKTRNAYYQDHQNCELCALRNIQNHAAEIHHIIKFYQQPTQDIRWKLLCDTDNLISLCKDHHHIVHNNQDLLDDTQKLFLITKKQMLEKKYYDNGIIINLTNDKQGTERKLF